MTRSSLPPHTPAPAGPEDLEDTQRIDARVLADVALEQLVSLHTAPAVDTWGAVDTWDPAEPPWPGGFVPEVDVGPARALVSPPAALGLVVSVVGLCAALTGLLAPVGLILGAAGLLLGVSGVIQAGKPGMAGRGLATTGMVCGLAAVALATVAMTGRYTWLTSTTNTVEQWHSWLVTRWPWLGHWS